MTGTVRVLAGTRTSGEHDRGAARLLSAFPRPPFVDEPVGADPRDALDLLERFAETIGQPNHPFRQEALGYACAGP